MQADVVHEWVRSDVPGSRGWQEQGYDRASVVLVNLTTCDHYWVQKELRNILPGVYTYRIGAIKGDLVFYLEDEFESYQAAWDHIATVFGWEPE